MTLRRLHGMSASLLAAYATAHLANHLAGLAGIDAHLSCMRALRSVYRIPAVEGLLLAATAFQAGSGLIMVVRGWTARRGLVPWLQAASGAYLAFFLSFHVGSVLVGRAALHLDTNFYFAAAGLHVTPFQFFFAPYYFLAVLALFTHAGCALYWQLERRSPRSRAMSVAIPAAAGFAVALAIVLMLGGALYPVVVPPAYRSTFGWHAPTVMLPASRPRP